MPERPTPPAKPRERRASPEAVSRLAGRIATDEPSLLRGFARRVGAPPDDVDDVVQSALLNFIRFYPGKAGDYEGAKRYLFSCIASATSKLHRRNYRKPRPASLPQRDRFKGGLPHAQDTEQVSIETAPGPDEVALDRILDGELREVLDQLPPDQFACLLLGAAGYGTAEIAEVLGLSPRQVRKRVGKANAALRRLH